MPRKALSAPLALAFLMTTPATAHAADAAATVAPRQVLARGGWKDSFAFMAGSGSFEVRAGT